MPPKRASRSAAAAEAEPSSVSSSSSAGASSPAPLPLSQRSVDIWIAVWFVLFAFSTTFTDLHNFTASVLGVEVSDLKALAAEVRGVARRRRAIPAAADGGLHFLFSLSRALYLNRSLARSPQGKLLWPPRALTALYFQWAETVDPLLYQNPVWWCAGAPPPVRARAPRARAPPRARRAGPSQAVHRVGELARPDAVCLCGPVRLCARPRLGPQ